MNYGGFLILCCVCIFLHAPFFNSGTRSVGSDPPSIVHSDSVPPHIDSLYQLGVDNYYSSRTIESLEEAVDFFDFFDSLVHAQNFTNDSIIGRMHILKGLTLGRLELPHEATGSLKRGLFFYKRYYPGADYNVYSTHLNIASYAYLADDLQLARIHLDSSLHMQINDEKTYKWARSLNLFGRLYGKLGDFSRSYAAFEAAYPYYLQLLPEELNQYYHDYALSLLRLNKPKMAIKASVKLPDNEYWISERSMLLARSYNTLNILDSAAHYYEQTKVYSSSLSDLDRAWLMNNIGTVHLKMNSIDAAASEFLQASELFKQLGDGSVPLDLAGNMSVVHLKKGDCKKSIQILDSIKFGLEEQMFTTSFDLLIFLHHQISHRLDCYRKYGNEQWIREAYELTKEIHKQIQQWREELTGGASRLNYAEYARQVYDKAIEVCYEMYHGEKKEEVLYQMLELVERNKALVLLEEAWLKQHDPEPGVSDQLNHFIQEIASLNSLDSQLAISDSIAWLLQYMGKDSIDGNSILQFTDEVIDLQDLKVGANSLNFFQHEDQGLTILSFVCGKLKTDHIDSSQWMPLAKEILAGFTSNRLSLSMQEEKRKALQTLGDLFFPDAECGELNRLVIVPDGILNFFPFDILIHKDKYWIEQINIHYSFSLKLLDYLNSLERYSGELVAFAPTFGGEETRSLSLSRASQDTKFLRPLLFNKEEVEQIQAVFPDLQTFLGTEANNENFANLASSAQLIHLATHAQASMEDESSARFFLAGSSKGDLESIDHSDIYNMHLPAELIVMSACETGLGKYVPGEGVMSFARAFTAAGSHSVVASLWPVNDQSTAEIMGYFYENLAKSMDKDEALRKAKLTYLANADPAYQDPYYWAGFIAIGSVDPLTSTMPAQWWFYVVLVLLAAGVIFFIKDHFKSTASSSALA